MKIVVTAFSPFGGYEENSSLEVLKRIDSTNIQKEILEVSYSKVASKLLTILEKEKPDYLLLLGQAANRSSVTLEKVAINYINTPTKDNDGVFYLNQKIDDNEQDAYFTNFEINEIINDLSSEYPVTMSYTAGTYVCNYSFFTALKFVKNLHLKTKVEFIHFPLIRNEINKTSLPLEEMVEITNKIINLITK